jgi:hypothetical protein
LLHATERDTEANLKRRQEFLAAADSGTISLAAEQTQPKTGQEAMAG